MDIDKVRAMTDPELEQALREAKQELWGARFALSTRQLKDYSTHPSDTSNDRADPDRPARAQARPDGLTGDRADDRSQR